MRSLNEIDWSHNPISVPPKAVLDRGVEATLQWLRVNESKLKRKH